MQLLPLFFSFSFSFYFKQTNVSERIVTCPPSEYSLELLEDGDSKEEEPEEAKEKKPEEEEEEEEEEEGEKGKEKEKESEEFKSCMLGYTSPTWMPCK